MSDTEPRLRATHNTTAEGIRFAVEVGGIPNPSLAIHRTDQPFQSMGEISLVAPLALVDPAAEDVAVYDADIYSVRTPARRYETTADTLALIAEIEREAARLDGSLGSPPGAEDLGKGREPEDVGRMIAGSMPGLSLFLQSRGITVDPVMGPPRLRSPGMETPEVQAFFRELDAEGVDFQRIETSDPEYARYSEAVRQGVTRVYAGAGLEPETIDDILHSQYIDPESGLVYFGKTTLVRADLEKLAEGTEVDPGATGAKIAELAEAEGGERAAAQWWEARVIASYGDAYFEAEGRFWANRLRAESVPARRTKYGAYKVPFTLDNLSVEMCRQSDPRARERNMTYGPGEARASGARKLASLSDLEEYREALVTQKERDAAKEAQAEKRAELSGVLASFHPQNERTENEFGVIWDTLDDLHRAIGRLSRSGTRSVAAARTALRRAEFEVERMPPGAIKMFVEYAESVLDAPTQYLEVKMMRPVLLNEFAAAIVSDRTPDDVVALLSAEGLDVVRYPHRDAQARMEAFHELENGSPTAQWERGIVFGGIAPTSDLTAQDDSRTRRIEKALSEDENSTAEVRRVSPKHTP